MIAVVNSLPVKEGAAGRILERFAESRGHVQRFPGFVSMEVMRSEGDGEVLVVTRWQRAGPPSTRGCAARSCVYRPHSRCLPLR